MVGAVPYIALQLKAVAASIGVVTGATGGTTVLPFGVDMALLVAVVMAAFAILFGTRHIDATEHHQGMVLAVAFESLVKLAFLLAGVVITSGASRRDRHPGAGTLQRARSLLPSPARLRLCRLVSLTVSVRCCVSRPAAPVPGGGDRERRRAAPRRAAWDAPALPAADQPVRAAAGGDRRLQPAEHDDMLVLTLAAETGHGWLVLLVFLGGLSAATAMVIVETVALSTMISNDLVMPVLLRWRSLGLNRRAGPDRGWCCWCAAPASCCCCCSATASSAWSAASYGLVSIGLIAFCGVAQFLPPIVAGIFFREANLTGALAGPARRLCGVALHADAAGAGRADFVAGAAMGPSASPCCGRRRCSASRPCIR